MNGFLDRLEKILQLRLHTAYIVEMDEDKAAIDAELIQIVRELRDAGCEPLPSTPIVTSQR